ncbi:MAG: hypothetical protein KDD44_12590, partial [Bdellovibrionales bacterium]|nr:hypothetical protein [Bdellovibrionales bacterium]
MASEESRLDALKAQMSDQQRRDMAEIIGNELKRREMEKQTSKQRTKSAVNSSGLSGGALKPDQVKELYGEVNDAVKQLRLKKLEGQLKEARAQEKHLKKASKPKTSAMASADLSAASSGALPSPVAMTSGLQRLAQGMNSLPTGKIFFLYALVAVG